MKAKAIICIILIISIIIICMYVFNSNIYIKLNGSKEQKVLLNNNYIENGATAKKCNKFKCSDISKELLIENSIDITKIGNYEVIYKITNNKKTFSQIRKVEVVDTEPPIIELIGLENQDICPNKEYIEDGYIAIDNYDGDITYKVKRIDYDSYIEYSVSDSSNNNQLIKRLINKDDNIKPTIKLNGKSIIEIKLGSNYIEQGAVAYDNCYGNITNDIKISHNINTSKEGTYNVLYSISDGNNTSTINRTVLVSKKSTFNTNDKNTYLNALEDYIKDKNYLVSIGYINLKTGYKYYYKPDTLYYGASLVKTVDALYIYENNITNKNIIDKVDKAISISDNDAHKYLVNYIGLNNLKAYGEKIGHQHFLTGKDLYGNTTVKDQIAVWEYLYSYINSHKNGYELQQYFINDYSNFLLFDEIPITMHKYGYYGDYYHESGIVYDKEPYIIVILTKHGKKNFNKVVSDLSKKMYDFNRLGD